MFSCLPFIVLSKKYFLVVGAKYIMKPARTNNQAIICNSNILKGWGFFLLISVRSMTIDHSTTLVSFVLPNPAALIPFQLAKQYRLTAS